MDYIKNFDKLLWATNKEIRKIIKTETLYFSGMITKINHYGMSQERSLLLTDQALYNMKKNEMKRRLDYKSIMGITYSKATNEFVIHGSDDEYDYQYISFDRTPIICLISHFYRQNLSKPIKLCEVEDKSLTNYVTSKKEKKKKADFTKMDEKFKIDSDNFLNQNEKEYKYLNKNNNVDQDQTEENNNTSEPNKNIKKIPTDTIFSKHKTVKEANINDFKKLKVIGRGAFAKVYFVQYLPTKEYFAMKAIKKDILIEQEQIENTLLEKNILQKIDHPFLVGLVFHLQTVERIYFVMPFIRGGELFQHLRKCRFFQEDRVKFYAAIIGLGIDYLHRNGIIYRDIKPENVLIDEDGYLKLIDFGMAVSVKDLDKTAEGFVGTPEYLAPEVIAGEGNGKSADWWSYGILVYEMLCGIPPFFSESTEQMYELITYSELKFPKKIKLSDSVKDLLKKLLCKNADLRLGSDRGFEDIKEHEFFRDIDFDALLEKKIKAPFKPKLEDIEDVGNFDPEFTSEEVVTSEIPEKNLALIRRNQEKFKDFDL